MASLSLFLLRSKEATTRRKVCSRRSSLVLVPPLLPDLPLLDVTEDLGELCAH